MTPSKEHKQAKPTKLKEEASFPMKVVGEVVIEDLPNMIALQECPLDSSIILEEKMPTKE